MFTDRLMRNQANEHSEAILPLQSQSSYSRVVEFSVQYERLCSLEIVASVYNILVSRKGMSFVFKRPIAGNPSEYANWSAMTIRPSSIQSLSTRRE